MRSDAVHSGIAPRELADFEGRWQVLRQITSEGAPSARFEGEAIWTPADGGLAYRETGRMILEGQPVMQAERRYFWAGDLSVHFEDGRFFHHVPPTGGTARHWCDPDNYELTYDVGAWPLFHVFWRVSGPRKSYTAQTQYTRC
jgi:hypothetical protein